MLTALSEGVKRYLPIALVLTFCNVPLPCATLERLSLDDMTSRSTVIVRGKIAGSYAAFAGTAPVIYTHYALQVSEWYKGLGGNTIDLVVPGGVVNNVRQSFSGAPTFSAGDEYVFFLWTSKAGLTQVIGLTQGNGPDGGSFLVDQGCLAGPYSAPLRQPRVDVGPGDGPTGKGPAARHAPERAQVADIGYSFGSGSGGGEVMRNPRRIGRVLVIAAVAVLLGTPDRK